MPKPNLSNQDTSRKKTRWVSIGKENMGMWYFREMGETIGPVSNAEMRRLALEGRFRPDTFVRKGVDADWVTADKVVGLLTARDEVVARHHPSESVATLDASVGEMQSPRRRILLIPVALVFVLTIAVVLRILATRERGSQNLKIASTHEAKPTATSAATQRNPEVPTINARVLGDVHEFLPDYVDTSSWMLSVIHGSEEYPLLTPLQVAAQVGMIDNADSGAARLLSGTETAFILEHKASLINFLVSLNDVGDDNVRFSFSRVLPLRVASKDGKPCLVVNQLADKNTYNTLRLTKKQRAAKVVERNVLPILQRADESLYDRSIASYCVLCYYGSADFSRKEPGSVWTASEVVAIIVSRDDCHAFANGDLSQERLLQKSEVFVGGREGLSIEKVRPRRVELVIE